MNKFLAAIFGAHGGLDRWNSFHKIEATIVTGGTLWTTKNVVQDATPRRMTAWVHEQRSSVSPYGRPEWYTNYTPGHIVILDRDGGIVQERSNPRASFAGHGFDTPWDPLQRAYFKGYALWNYFTAPFLLALPGVEVEEIDPREGDHERWRVLRARFPIGVGTHSTEQQFYFSSGDLHLRRHDYQVDVAGGFATAQMVHDYIEANGLSMPGRRRAYLRGPRREVLSDTLLVSIDISQLSYR